MCGCGRTSMPCPAGSRAGPNSSTKMKGPTIVLSRLGSVRLTLKAPRSWVTGAIVWRTGVSIVAIAVLLPPFNPAAHRAHRASAPNGDKEAEEKSDGNDNRERLEEDAHQPDDCHDERVPCFAHGIAAEARHSAATVVVECHRRA